MNVEHSARGAELGEASDWVHSGQQDLLHLRSVGVCMWACVLVSE
jgi:hypothetical protein